MNCKLSAGFGVKLRPGRAAFICCLAIGLLGFLSPASRLTAELLTLSDWLDLGWDYYNAGNLDEAFNTFLETVDKYPDSAEAHLALGKVYLEMGVVERGRAELLRSLQLDDESSLAAVAHYEYAVSMREEDTWLALLHLNRAHEIGGAPSLHFEIAHQMRFCNILLNMPGRSENGPLVLHYPDYLFADGEAEKVGRDSESELYLVESFCYFDLDDPVHFFIYPSVRALYAEIVIEEDQSDPSHREFHVAYEPDMDLLDKLCMQVVYDLQQELNRHAGAEWVLRGLPTAVTGLIPLSEAVIGDKESGGVIGCDQAVCTLVDSGTLIDLSYLTSEEFQPYIPDMVARAEIGSFLRWVRRTYDSRIFQELITQPNIEIVLDAGIEELQHRWIHDLANTPNLIADPELSRQWAAAQPLSPLAGHPDMPLDVLKEGLRLYLSGQETAGLWEIHRSLELDPGLALGYYTLGWIECSRGDYEDAEEHLETALLLFESEEAIAWCHAMLAPIYLSDARWDLAQGSLQLVMTCSDSDDIRNWAMESAVRLNHIQMLRPFPLDRDSVERGLMRDFMQEWNRASNSDEGVGSLISSMMDDTRGRSLAQFYSALREEYPTIVFNHAVQEVGRAGSAIMVELRIQAAFRGPRPRLTGANEALIDGGYLLYFQVIPTEDGWRVLDWEDGEFPLTSVQLVQPMTIEIE